MIFHPLEAINGLIKNEKFTFSAAQEKMSLLPANALGVDVSCFIYAVVSKLSAIKTCVFIYLLIHNYRFLAISYDVYY